MVNGMAGLQFHPTRCHLNLEPGIDTNATIVSACLWATASATGKKVVGNNQWRAITIAAATCLHTIQVARQLDLCGFSNHSHQHSYTKSPPGLGNLTNAWLESESDEIE